MFFAFSFVFFELCHFPSVSRYTVHSQWNFDIIASIQPVTYKLKGGSMKHTCISVEALAKTEAISFSLTSGFLLISQF